MPKKLLPSQKKGIVRTASVRLKGQSLILESMLDEEIPINDIIIFEVRKELMRISDSLEPLT